MKKKVFLLFLLLAAAAVLAGCASPGQEAKKRGKWLRVGVRTDISGVSMYNEEADTYYGLEADIANELAYAMGYDGATFVGVDASTREEALSSGKVDCLVASYTATPERAERFDLSIPYYTEFGIALVEESTLFSQYKDLSGAVIGVRKGSSAREKLAEGLCEKGLIPEATDEALCAFATIVEMDSYTDMSIALETGDADAICGDSPILLPMVEEGRICISDPYSQEDYVIATVKGSPLSAPVNQAVRELKESGVFGEIRDKWGV